MLAEFLALFNCVDSRKQIKLLNFEQHLYMLLQPLFVDLGAPQSPTKANRLPLLLLNSALRIIKQPSLRFDTSDNQSKLISHRPCLMALGVIIIKTQRLNVHKLILAINLDLSYPLSLLNASILQSIVRQCQLSNKHSILIDKYLTALLDVLFQ